MMSSSIWKNNQDFSQYGAENIIYCFKSKISAYLTEQDIES